jgi:hypothetical protein
VTWNQNMEKNPNWSSSFWSKDTISSFQGWLFRWPAILKKPNPTSWFSNQQFMSLEKGLVAMLHICKVDNLPIWKTLKLLYTLDIYELK